MTRQECAAMVVGGWAHFSEGRADLARAFDDAGLTGQLRLGDHGTWIPLGTL
jgi:hypothetical protein